MEKSDDLDDAFYVLKRKKSRFFDFENVENVLSNYSDELLVIQVSHKSVWLLFCSKHVANTRNFSMCRGVLTCS